MAQQPKKLVQHLPWKSGSNHGATKNIINGVGGQIMQMVKDNKAINCSNLKDYVFVKKNLAGIVIHCDKTMVATHYCKWSVQFLISGEKYIFFCFPTPPKGNK